MRNIEMHYYFVFTSFGFAAVKDGITSPFGRYMGMINLVQKTERC
jgi:hypothetical protein